MSRAPEVVERAEQPYVGIRMAVTMRTVGTAGDRIADVIGWLAARGITPAGPPFLKYDVIDMTRHLEVEAGVPVAAVVDGEAELQVQYGVLPAGRYATVSHVGHPSELVTVTAALLAWAADRGLHFDVTGTDAGDQWGCRLEIYLTDPREQPDMHQWEIQLAFRLAS